MERSKALFFKYGVRNITMDDIAEKCGVSKATIYKYFANKDQLLHNILEEIVQELQDTIWETRTMKKNAIEELTSFFIHVKGLSEGISLSFIKELKKYHSAIFIEVIKYINTMVIPFVIENIKRGKQEGMYKKDLNAKEFCYAFNDVLKIVFFDVPLNYSEDNKNVLRFLSSLFLHRLVSIEGLRMINTSGTTDIDFMVIQ
ncbi:TetR/AcrR family transcriptional regulator [Muricauda sp. SCSIO 64092]|uniref:TetR/AcrR family transcriptional regulator n=1 Tax=Allomuricauda sp. SCSIO 64092 TaxID=2908842 RepID=UPI001FF3B482|nr:TetR/AcrR family transcriptional regulator [Muricauda sp. SCSIO 64092]UOY08282.1 TetR/AcrR family transcriptional regulator [Muricauda sp. SCSIO 64092]